MRASGGTLKGVEEQASLKGGAFRVPEGTCGQIQLFMRQAGGGREGQSLPCWSVTALRSWYVHVPQWYLTRIYLRLPHVQLINHGMCTCAGAGI